MTKGGRSKHAHNVPGNTQRSMTATDEKPKQNTRFQQYERLKKKNKPNHTPNKTIFIHLYEWFKLWNCIST